MVILVTLRKGNHPDQAYVRKEPKKSFTQQREWPHEELEIRPLDMSCIFGSSCGLETWEELGLQHRYMLRKGKSAVEGDPKKSWCGIKTEVGVE